MGYLTLEWQANKQQPLYEQLYRHIVGEIQAGRLPEGMKLPSKRDLCADLKISGSTVETAYGLLVAEGYVRAVPKSGYYVCPAVLPDPVPQPPAQESPPVPESSVRFSFSTSAVDTSLFPYATYAKLTKETVYQNPALLQRGDKQGDRPLRQALCDMLHQYRGVNSTPDRILLGAGMDILLDLTLQLLGPDTVFAVEDPGYGATYQTLRNNGRTVVPVPLDNEGLSAEALAKTKANVAYVTPSHQFPAGVTMPVGRRMQLLRWASEQPGRYLIEDDYDSEFRYATRPLPAMQSLDQNNRVIYIGTFSRSIAPAIRVAYLVLPPALMERYHQQFVHGASTVSRFEQHTLYRFLQEGYYARYLRRVSLLYRRRCQYLCRLLAAIPAVVLSGHQAGLHFLLTVPAFSETELIRRAAAVGVRVHGLSQYSHGAAVRPSTLVLGFAGLDESTMEEAVSLLKSAWAV